ncbi:rod shape-determining protein MreD [Neoroseomonas oryzicola]|uniref:Rod shape-determining protein MreD n=1 Tax=Neoroseomonas oryzicola TaxID=535904 RepID=A0A9X9WHX5_9PROT|nr:rod shape-determining protein MreD [Neoroseomonas oryzicola]MBR0659935.1 rod shape-determining protein MreD [Neoroseomonas oryzicola]NKE16478.1 rod shape-determining protein MreD [Neoroseomonas oryzicola]
MANPPFRRPEGRPAPAPGLLRRIDAFARLAFPGVSTAVLMVLAAAPVSLPSPVLAAALPCVAFWTVFRPAAMSPPVTFALGLLMDLLTMAPLGAGVLVLLAVHAAALRLRRFLARQSFLAVWLAFCVAAVGAAALYWALQALLALRLPPIAPAMHGAMLAAGLYPLIALVLTRIHEAMRIAENTP